MTNIEDWTARADDRLQSVMMRFNKLPHGFCIVVDGDGRPLGTVTDGDIRRAILAGITVESAIGEAMQAEPVIGRLDDPGTARAEMAELGFIPMVDAVGVLREIWVSRGEPKRISTALVMAGGFGTRLGEHTRERPKPLVDVGGKPIMEHILAWLEASEVESIFVSTHYRADQIHDFLNARAGSIPVDVLHETDSLGTAGSLAELGRRLGDSLSSPVLVVNGDVLTELDLRAFADFHQAHSYDCTLAVSTHRQTVPFGVVLQDDQRTFVGINEKPTYSYFVASGIYLLEPEFCHMVSPGVRLDMPDLLNRGREAGLSVGLFPIHEYWRDIGRPEDIDAAERDNGGGRR